jgi:glycosyltransferase involved in cell wall biosynthesis
MSENFWQPLVSIIMPAYNAGDFIAEAIQSVLEQEHQHWELIIINDGSTDNTEEIVKSFNDDRIQYYSQKNNGVSAARNVGLDNMKGDFYAFLDADDIYTPINLSARLKVFEQRPDVDFVDGSVEVFDNDTGKVLRTWTPNFEGNPLRDLVRLSGKSFFSPTWLIRNKFNKQRFALGITHSEDLAYLIDISSSEGKYLGLKEVIIRYRSSSGQAMSNLDGLRRGYNWLLIELANVKKISTLDVLIYFIKTRIIIFLTYLRIEKSVGKAFYNLLVIDTK